MATDGTVAGRIGSRRTAALVGFVLCAATFVVFLPLRNAAFVNYDDGAHVTANLHVQGGLTWAGLAWAFTNWAKWIPLTWMSHMLDCQLYGLNPGGHHMSSVLLHVFNTGLLLTVLFRFTGALWPSAFVAALFALHPLHVEPVAWISSRPHLVGTLFWFTALLAYARYCERRSVWRYAVVAGCMMCSAMGKGMVVTLPLILLLLDYWPLGRWPQERGWRAAWPLVREKLPLCALAAADVAMQLVEQRLAGSLVSLDTSPLTRRLVDALIGYAGYLATMLWPAGLAVLYPRHVAWPPLWQVAASAATLLGISAAVIHFGRAHRYLVTGWLWYLITLLPVIGIVSIGWQATADRYTYVPLIGPFVMIAWGARDVVRRRPAARSAVALLGCAAIAVCVPITRRQLSYWQDSVTLFRRTLAVTVDNAIAENNLGVTLRMAGDRDGARAHIAAALRIDPQYAEAHNNMGLSLSEDGQLAEAEQHFRAALRLVPQSLDIQENLVDLLWRRGDVDGALQVLRDGAARQPNNAAARLALAQGLERAGLADEAQRAYEEAARLDPDTASRRPESGRPGRQE